MTTSDQLETIAAFRDRVVGHVEAYAAKEHLTERGKVQAAVRLGAEAAFAAMASGLRLEAPVAVSDASVRECVMFANLHLRGERTDQIGTELTVEISTAYDKWLAGIRADILRGAADILEAHWSPDTAEGEEIVEGSVALLRAQADELFPAAQASDD